MPCVLAPYSRVPEKFRYFVVLIICLLVGARLLHTRIKTLTSTDAKIRCLAFGVYTCRYYSSPLVPLVCSLSFLHVFFFFFPAVSVVFDVCVSCVCFPNCFMRLAQQSPSGAVRLKIRIDQQLYVSVHKKKVTSLVFSFFATGGV